MTCGVLYEWERRKPWDAGMADDTDWQARAQGQCAEERGVASVWTVEPHPAIWMATTQPESFTLAGQKGIGVLGFLLGVEVDAIGRHIQEYRSALNTAEPVGAFINDQAGVFTITHRVGSNKAAREHAELAVMWYMQRSIGFFAQWGKPDVPSLRATVGTPKRPPNAANA
jgi:hypothetical protein